MMMNSIVTSNRRGLPLTVQRPATVMRKPAYAYIKPSPSSQTQDEQVTATLRRMQKFREDCKKFVDKFIQRNGLKVPEVVGLKRPRSQVTDDKRDPPEVTSAKRGRREVTDVATEPVIEVKRVPVEDDPREGTRVSMEELEAEVKAGEKKRKEFEAAYPRTEVKKIIQAEPPKAKKLADQAEPLKVKKNAHAEPPKVIDISSEVTAYLVHHKNGNDNKSEAMKTRTPLKDVNSKNLTLTNLKGKNCNLFSMMQVN